METVYSDDHRLQDGKSELIDGKLLPCFEMPRRADMILARVRAVGLGPVVAPDAHGRAPIERVHDAGFLRFLETAWDAWLAAHGAYDALPLVWPTRGMRQREPEAIDGKLSYFAIDAGTPITAGTWRAATTAVDVALTGAARITAGARAVFSLCRPPGHHAGADTYGGYCFLNNAAVAAQALRDAGAARVAILDVDYHHGNGTQGIFYARDDVLFTSIHGHPAQEFPFFLGYDDETGEGRGTGYNANFPLRWGAGWEQYAEALAAACARIVELGADALVVSLGVDTFEGDPISHFRLRGEDYPRIGRAIAGLALPTLFVMEGGYAVEEIGVNAVAVLTGFEGD
ncbi:MAG: histone deacetylase family protein [Ectothiorhodospiraceae bacterium]|nr:histone deacetylase family protein [Ectothiorhodospiraceae bacterium]